MKSYIHGYSAKESARLTDQASTLAELLHTDTVYSQGAKVLEAGCGTGAQTVILAQNNPNASITSIDMSGESLKEAKRKIKKLKIKNVRFRKADIFRLPFPKDSFDHVFLCFVLEHLSGPVAALKKLKCVLKKNGTITVIEGDHGSAYFYPMSREASQAIECLVTLQSGLKGNALIGRELYHLLNEAGFKKAHVSPRMVYADPSKPEWVKGFTKNTFIAMVEGVREEALAKGLMDKKRWEKGISDLYSTMNGTFCYTFFKGVARKLS